MPRRWSSVFYWIGVVLAIACVALVFISHRALAWRFEIAGAPLTFVAGIAAAVAFLLYEMCSSASGSPPKKT